ncbi:hypothetical protein MNV49_000828 [Pseudohyphozyma bogoriensis]|nr:hypothetical protein MNV49_000828 [Pseudohyphozyma bogoriensis]
MTHELSMLEYEQLQTKEFLEALAKVSDTELLIPPPTSPTPPKHLWPIIAHVKHLQYRLERGLRCVMDLKSAVAELLEKQSDAPSEPKAASSVVIPPQTRPPPPDYFWYLIALEKQLHYRFKKGSRFVIDLKKLLTLKDRVFEEQSAIIKDQAEEIRLLKSAVTELLERQRAAASVGAGKTAILGDKTNKG